MNFKNGSTFTINAPNIGNKRSVRLGIIYLTLISEREIL